MTANTRFVGGLQYNPAVIGYQVEHDSRVEITVLRAACGCQLPTADFEIQVVCAAHQRPSRPVASYPVGG